MPTNSEARVAEAFLSMLRTDYISLNDTDKLELLSTYYVDYFGYLPEILSEIDQLVVGRRGTGKTTLVYRALVECMRSWDRNWATAGIPHRRTLGIYVDLSKCQSLSSDDASFTDFEHAFVTEVCDAISEQITRFWPALSQHGNFFTRLFRAAETKRASEVRETLERISALLSEGLPRVIDRTGPVQMRENTGSSIEQAAAASVGVNLLSPAAQASLRETAQDTTMLEQTYATTATYRLAVSDILRILSELRERASLSAIFLFVDEFSALTEGLQRRFCTLLRKFLGSHAGVFIKLCGITDNYTLGSAIILQRDLFEMSLDLDTYVERSGTFTDALEGLRGFAEKMVTSRLSAYQCPTPSELIDSPEEAWLSLSRAAMGVPRTIGIVLKQAWSQAVQAGKSPIRIRKTDIASGIRYASNAYLNQFLGASRDGIAIPAFYLDLWTALLERAQQERAKISTAEASHFLVLPKNEKMLSLLNMFFLVHLLTRGRTTKKERFGRSLYCFDFGICEENNLGFGTDKNVIRQQRFVYDGALAPFEKFFGVTTEVNYSCETCGAKFKQSELEVAGTQLTFCPHDKTDLVEEQMEEAGEQYTEEEVKIVGTIRCARREDRIYARQVADDVGCYVQKVAKFGEKLERVHLINRERDPEGEKYIYFSE